ncbi:5-oxoprolinase subunit B family protein [Coraliomargarita akajimensis]|uniref:Allophanate hydrolase subunit 1 n=1 Tax=Coraliomargarita akajimensis (strain DSM 45221 / IAM 15411 / JCM 23193 / KCTC 12865 / 04OKA010-24) TaxID=583355 RepID=D5EIJ3_CORAD|nr:allophanate hydrolase subunit 1 [Coraliomargarita akajimensis]ADE54259.1 Allophanate hydrolase subunit 1 [Coraliomargarita akajimensis DSM 45221]
MDVELRPYGERALLVQAAGLDDLSCRSGLSARLVADAGIGVVDFVWGADNLLLCFASVPDLRLVQSWFRRLDLDATAVATRLHEVVVRYDGPDLDFVADQVGLSVDRVIALHSQPEYVVRMLGFSPGFPYLDGLNHLLHMERRSQPRLRIEPGAVAIGGPHAGIYSVASPGGWHLLGRTDYPLFNDEAANSGELEPSKVFAFQPGDRVRFMPQ